MAITIQTRRDTAANWTLNNPILANGEAGYETDTGKEKKGDGLTAWTSLAYQIGTVVPESALFTDTIYDDSTTVVDGDIGVTVQAYDADTTKNDVANTFTISQRGTLTTDNDGSFDMDVTNNFKCTPAGNFTLTFTNIAAQGGDILLVNTGGHTVSAAATTKVDSTLLATISAAGTYAISYMSDGTNVYVTGSQALA